MLPYFTNLGWLVIGVCAWLIMIAYILLTA